MGKAEYNIQNLIILFFTAVQASCFTEAFNSINFGHGQMCNPFTVNLYRVKQVTVQLKLITLT